MHYLLSEHLPRNHFYLAGIVVEFISIPVSSAFGTAVAMTILGTEMKNFLGLNYKSQNFYDSLRNLRSHIIDTRSGDLSLGVICVVFLILLDVSERS